MVEHDVAYAFSVLGISPTAGEAHARRARLKLVRKFHPDLYKGDRAKADRKMAQINAAFDEVMVELRRRGQCDAKTAMSEAEENRLAAEKARRAEAERKARQARRTEADRQAREARRAEEARKAKMDAARQARARGFAEMSEEVRAVYSAAASAYATIQKMQKVA